MANDDDSNFRSAIGEELYAAGKAEEGEAWFRNWLRREPHNENAWSVFSWCVQEHEGAEAAYRSFSDSIEKADYYNDLYDDFRMPIQKPIVKEKKVYPNDPCPCGSGKNIKNAVGKEPIAGCR